MGPSDALRLALFIYSCSTTVVLIGLVIYIILLKRNLARSKSEDHSPEDIITLHRQSISNKYEDSPHMRSKRSSSQVLSPPKKRVTVASDYDIETCTSRKVTTQPEDSSSHHYEDVVDKNKGHLYETIMNEVASTLCSLYPSAYQEKELYEQFLRQLMRTIRSKNPQLYMELEHFGVSDKHKYEVIGEEAKKSVEGKEDSDETYAKYLPASSKHATFSADSLGSSEHMRFLKLGKAKSLYDASYLQPRRFTAKSDCPEGLKRLCDSQYQPSPGPPTTSANPKVEPRPATETLHPTDAPPLPPRTLLVYARLFCESHGLGLTISSNNKGVYVTRIAEGGAAEKSGKLRVGDRLVRINGTEVGGAKHRQVVALVRGLQGVVSLVAEREVPEGGVREKEEATGQQVDAKEAEESGKQNTNAWTENPTYTSWCEVTISSSEDPSHLGGATSTADQAKTSVKVPKSLPLSSSSREDFL